MTGLLLSFLSLFLYLVGRVATCISSRESSSRWWSQRGGKEVEVEYIFRSGCSNPNLLRPCTCISRRVLNTARTFLLH
ncbi:hypothetical protein K474DRAFT_1667694 [Panus rudis PR-1116 ss-1]|nr:hypothetical protein K474DRAFT_1667694 [Panus rudis PR-1116 ss-1]